MLIGLVPPSAYLAPSTPSAPPVAGPASSGFIGSLLAGARARAAAAGPGPGGRRVPGGLVGGLVAGARGIAVARQTPATLLANAPTNTPERRSADAAAAAAAAGRARAAAKGYGY